MIPHRMKQTNIEPPLSGLTPWVLHLLVGIGVASPLLFIPSFAFPFQNGKLVLLLIAIVLALPFIVPALWHHGRQNAFWSDPLFGILLAMLGAWGISALIGLDPLMSWQGSVERADGLLLWCALFVWLLGARILFHLRPHAFLKHKRLLLTSSGIVGGIALLEWLGVFSSETSLPGISATMGNPNFLGAVLLLPFFWSLEEAHRSTGRTRLWMGLIAFLCLTGLLLSGSRGALVGLVAGVVSLGISYKVSPSFSLRIHWVWVSLSGCLTVLVAVLFLAPEFVQQLLSYTGESGIVRSFYWKYAVQGWGDHPLFGVGVQNFGPIANQLYEPALYAYHYFDIWPDRVHNQFLEVLLTTGMIGTGFYLALWSALLTRTWKHPFLFAGLVATAIQLVLSLDTLAVLVFLFFVMAFLLTEEANDTPSPATAKGRLPLFVASIGLSTALMFLIVLPRIQTYQSGETPSSFGSSYRAQQHATAVITDLQDGTEVPQADVENTRERFRLSVTHHPHRAEYWYAWAVFEQERAAAQQIAVDPAGYAAIKQVQTLAPQRVEALVLHAGMLAHDGQTQEALDQLESALSRSPLDVQGHLLRAHIYTDQERILEAADEYLTLVKHTWWHPAVQNKDLLLSLIQVYYQKGDVQTLHLLAERLLELDPSLHDETEAFLEQLGV